TSRVATSPTSQSTPSGALLATASANIMRNSPTTSSARRVGLGLRNTSDTGTDTRVRQTSRSDGPPRGLPAPGAPPGSCFMPIRFILRPAASSRLFRGQRRKPAQLLEHGDGHRRAHDAGLHAPIVHDDDFFVNDARLRRQRRPSLPPSPLH